MYSKKYKCPKMQQAAGFKILIALNEYNMHHNRWAINTAGQELHLWLLSVNNSEGP